MPRDYSQTGAASRALHTILDARSGLSDAQVEWGWPGEQRHAADLVWVGGVENTNQATAALGQRRREETFNVFVFCDALRDGSAALVDISQAAVDLARQVEEAMHDNLTLNDTVRSALVTAVEPDPAMPVPGADGAYQAAVRVTVACAGRV